MKVNFPLKMKERYCWRPTPTLFPAITLITLIAIAANQMISAVRGRRRDATN